MTESEEPGPEPVAIPITDELDLHFFSPRDVGSVVKEYLLECQKKGILRVRLIHGKGIGALRRTVHKELERHPAVVDFHLGGQGHGGWGATIAILVEGGE